MNANFVCGTAHGNPKGCPLNHGNVICAIANSDSSFNRKREISSEFIKPAGFRYAKCADICPRGPADENLVSLRKGQGTQDALESITVQRRFANDKLRRAHRFEFINAHQLGILDDFPFGEAG